MCFPLRDEITGGYPIKMKIHFRQEGNHIYSHSEWNCHSSSFNIFQSAQLFEIGRDNKPYMGSTVWLSLETPIKKS